MVTFAGKQDDPKDLVINLLNLERDAIAAYDETIQRLDDVETADKIREFRSDHLHHAQALTEVAKSMGCKEMPDEGPKSILTKGKVVLADMAGDDAILGAMKSNENDTVSAYENAMENENVSGDLKMICEKALGDERRHRDYMEAHS